jgi:hypothetical protein
MLAFYLRHFDITPLHQPQENFKYNLLKYPIEGLDNRPLGVTGVNWVNITVLFNYPLFTRTRPGALYTCLSENFLEKIFPVS